MNVLFADNDAFFLTTRAEFLEKAGYQVWQAPSLAEAKRLLQEGHIHLAILDIRLENDDDEKDVSGLTLAKDPAYRSIPKIILTGFPSYEHVREALGPVLDGLPPALDFVSKAEGPERLIDAVTRVFAHHNPVPGAHCSKKIVAKKRKMRRQKKAKPNPRRKKPA